MPRTIEGVALLLSKTHPKTGSKGNQSFVLPSAALATKSNSRPLKVLRLSPSFHSVLQSATLQSTGRQPPHRTDKGLWRQHDFDQSSKHPASKQTAWNASHNGTRRTRTENSKHRACAAKTTRSAKARRTRSDFGYPLAR